MLSIYYMHINACSKLDDYNASIYCFLFDRNKALKDDIEVSRNLKIILPHYKNLYVESYETEVEGFKCLNKPWPVVMKNSSTFDLYTVRVWCKNFN